MAARRGLLPALIALAFALAACGGSGSPGVSGSTASGGSFPISVADDDGVQVSIKTEPRRIVTFAPSNTEIVFGLGLGDRLVGVSGDYDNYPPEAKGIAHIGGAGEFGVDPNIEKVVALRPDLLLAISGGDQWKQRLRDLGIAVFTINATDFDDLLHDIGTIGRITGAGDQAAQLVQSMRAKAGDVTSAVSAEPRTSCFFEAYYPPLTTVGPNTFLYDLLVRAGCDPVSKAAKSDYPQWSVDQLVRQSPQVYLVSSESGVSVKSVGQRPGFGSLKAVKDGRVSLVNSDLITRPGPRVVQGLELLANLLHPGQAAA
jgi:iron complex transport system substrate-binding protein